MKKYLVLSLSDVVFIMLINVKMPTFVGILTFMSRIISCSAELSKENVLLPRGQVFSAYDKARLKIVSSATETS